MSWKATGLVKELVLCADGAPLTLSAKMIYLLLAEAHNTTHRIAWPSISELAELGLMSYRQVQRQLRFLEEHGEIRQIRPDGQGKGMICSYRLLRLDPETGAAPGQDGEQQRVPNRHPSKTPPAIAKGDQQPPFFAPKDDGRVTEGRQKGDPTATLKAPPKGSESRGNGGTGEQSPNLTPGGALKREHVAAWMEIKQTLAGELPEAEWNLWVRPARLLRVSCGTQMLVAVPPQGKIIAAAHARRGRLLELARSAGFGISLTPYPDDWQREELKRRHGIDLTPKGRTA